MSLSCCSIREGKKQRQDLRKQEEIGRKRVRMGEEDMPQVIVYLSSLLQRVAESNDDDSAGEVNVSAFHGLSRPAISVRSYLERIFKYADCSSSCYVVAYVYLDRFLLLHPSLPLSSFSVHRLLITAVLLAAKFMDDRYYNNAYYAKVGGISTAEMNLLELDFLFGLGFQLNVTPTTFHTYCSHLHKEVLMLCVESPIHMPTRPTQLNKLQYCCFNEDEQSSSSPTASTAHQKQLAV